MTNLESQAPTSINVKTRGTTNPVPSTLPPNVTVTELVVRIQIPVTFDCANTGSDCLGNYIDIAVAHHPTFESEGHTLTQGNSRVWWNDVRGVCDGSGRRGLLTVFYIGEYRLPSGATLSGATQLTLSLKAPPQAHKGTSYDLTINLTQSGTSFAGTAAPRPH